jgi:hypothetical protein
MGEDVVREIPLADQEDDYYGEELEEAARCRRPPRCICPNLLTSAKRPLFGR